MRVLVTIEGDLHVIIPEREMGQQAETLRALSEIYDDEDVTNALNDMLDTIVGRSKKPS